jgi:N-acetylmuramoyl-L-alanine amidase
LYYGQAPAVSRVQAIRFWSFGDVTRIAVQTEGGYRLSRDQIDNPARAFFDFSGLRPPSSAHHGFETLEVNDHRVKQIRIAPLNSGTTRIVFDLEAPADIIYSQLVNPDRLMIEIRPRNSMPPGVLVTRSISGAQKLDEVAVGEPTPAARNGVTPPAVIRAPASGPAMTPDTTSQGAVVSRPLTKDIPAPVPPSTLQQATLTPTRLPSVNPEGTAPNTKALDLKTAPPGSVPSGASVTSAPVNGSTGAAPSAKYDGVVVPPKPGASTDRSLVRVFGLKMAKIVIDPGHGGHDTGTIGPDGMLEKDLVLDVALRLGALITKQLGAEVVYTRSADVFVPLEQRTQIANDQKADLFISIHANSSTEPRATGVETYYFNFTSDQAGLDLATRENAMASSSISDLNDLLHKAVLQTKLEESREFAQAVQTSLWGMSVKMNSLSKNRGVRKAPFVVLIGATMPSILSEVGFVSNPHDEKLMRRTDQRQKIAESLYKGVAAYTSSLGHLQIARANGN